MTPTFPRNKRHALIALAIAIAAAGCGSGSPEAMLASAKDYMAKNDLPAATIQLKNALSKQPDSAETRFLLGKVLLDSGDAVAAELELRKALDLKHPAGQVNPALARALLAQGQFKKVTDELGNATAESPQDKADLLTTIGTSQILQGQKEAALKSFEAALAAQADYPAAVLGKARLKVADNDVAAATALIDDLIAKTPTNADAWHFKADLLRVTGKLPEALDAYSKTLEIRPSSTSAHAASIMIHLRSQKPDLAKTQLDAMQKTAAKHPLTQYMQGLVAYARKDLPAVRSAMEALLKTQPDNPQGLQLAGIVAFETRADLQAQEFLSKALQKAPSLDYGRRILTLSYLRSGQPDKAQGVLQPVLHGAETAPVWLALAGEVHLQNGDLKTAEDFFRRSTQADPANAANKTALAMAQMQMGRVDQALSDLEQIAAADSGATADMALISSNMQQRQFDKALKAIANLEKKQPDSPAAFNLRGMALLGKKDVAGARQSFEKALSINPAYLPAASSLAQLDLAEKQPDKARQRFESVLAKDAQNVQAMLSLARLNSQSGASPEDITKLLMKAIAAAPNEPAPRIELIRHYLTLKDHQKALSALQDALAALPDRPEILDVAGRVYQTTGDNQQALSSYSKLAALMPANPQPYLRMAEIEIAAGKKDNARNTLNKGLTLQPNAFPLLRALIMLDVDGKQFDAALAKSRDIQKAYPKAAIGHLVEGDLQAIQKAWDKAAIAYRAGMKIQPANELLERLYGVLMQSGQTAEAGNVAANWLKEHPQDLAFRIFLAESSSRRNDYDGAVAQYRQILALQPNNPVILNNLAWVLGQKGDPKAIETAEQALKLAPKQPAIMDTLAVLLIKEGKATERGIDLLTQAVKLAPQAADIRMHLARALIKTGNKAAAKQELDVLAKLGDKHPLQAEVAELRKGL